MKFGKKDKSQDSAGKKTDDKKAKGSSKPTGGSKQLSFYQYIILAVVIIPVLGAAVLADLTVFSAAEKHAMTEFRQSHADLARLAVNQRVSELTRQAEIVASSTSVTQMAEVGEFSQLSELKSLLLHAERLVVLPKDKVGRTAPDGSELSFANLDMVKRTVNGEKVNLEAFSQEGKWLLQIARLVTSAVDDRPLGVVLVVYSLDALNNVLKPLAGKTEVLQSLGGAKKAIAIHGSANGVVETVAITGAANWELNFSIDESRQIGSIDRVMHLATVGAGVLIAMVLVFVIFAGMLKALRKDFVGLTSYGQRLLKEGPSVPPQLTFATVFTIAKNLEMAAKSGVRQPVSVAPEAQAVASEAPLFQDNSSLDIDMLADDEDLLAMNDHQESSPVASQEESEPLFGSDDDGLEIAEISSVDVPVSIFRAYDIRGTVGDVLTPEVVKHIGLAIGSEAALRGLDTICVGYDGRLSSPEIADVLIEGITQTGRNVVNVGRVPTPVLYFATHHLENGSGVMITGSHNPSNYNGFKMVLGGETLAGDDIQKLYNRITMQDYTRGKGAIEQQDIRREYIDAILNDIAVAAPLKVVLDAGNGIAGELGPMLIEELGCEVVPLHCDVDGNFPNHHPDPGKPENLEDLIAAVRNEGADIGIAFDGDGDRIGVVTNEGKVIWPDRLLMLYAKDVVSRNPGADIIFDVKCSRRVGGLISEYGGRPVMWKTGHSLIKSKMKETGALLAGEMSGHVFFKERWYGFDDALYSAARLLEILGLDERSAHEIFDTFPEDVSTPEINVHVTDENKFDIVQKLAENGQFGDGNVTSIDGVRVDYADGWGLCRASNTTPMLVLRFEADDEAALERIKTLYREQLLKVDSSLSLEF